MLTVRAYGLVFASEFPLPGLPAAEGEPDVRVSQGTVPFHGQEWRAWECAPDGSVVLRLPGLATLRIDRASILVDAPSGADVGAFLVANAIPLVLLMRGLLLMHGSAVDSPEGAVVLVGRVAVGKSTLAAALGQRGYPLLSDHVIALSFEGGTLRLVPSYPEHRLWADVMPTLGLEESAFRQLRTHIRKCAVPPRSWVGETRPLRAIFLTNVSELIARPVRPQPAYTCHQLLCYRRPLVTELGLWEPYRAMCTHLAETVPHFQLARPQDLSLLATVIDRVEHCLESAQRPTGRVVPAAAETPTQTYERPPGFVWLASFPKSGNTWVRAMLTAWADGTGQPPNLSNLLGHSSLVERHFFDEQIGIDSELLKSGERHGWQSRLYVHKAQQVVGWRLRKMHAVCERLADGRLLFPPEATVGVIYVIRNPLDVAASFAHHYRTSIEQAVLRMSQSTSWIHWPPGGSRDSLPQRIGTWSENVRSWVEQSGHIVLTLRYEDMLADPRGVLRRLIDALGGEWDEARADAALRASEFSSLQSEERRSGFLERPAGSEIFFRQGRSGGWRQSLAPALARKICLDHGETMKRYGYGAEVEEVLGR